MLCSLKPWWETVLLISLPPQTLPTATASVLRDLMMNGVMAVACPPLHEMLRPYFDKLETADCQVRYLGKHKANLGWICFPTSLHLVISEDQVTFHYIWEDVVIPELCPVFWGQALWTTGAASYWGSARAVVPLQWGVHYCLFETMHGNVSLCVSVRWCGGCPTVTGFLFSLDYQHNKVYIQPIILSVNRYLQQFGQLPTHAPSSKVFLQQLL